MTVIIFIAQVLLLINVPFWLLIEAAGVITPYASLV
jgi:hypothetical protein